MLYLKHIPFVNVADYILDESGNPPARSQITMVQPTKVNRVAILGQGLLPWNHGSHHSFRHPLMQRAGVS